MKRKEILEKDKKCKQKKQELEEIEKSIEDIKNNSCEISCEFLHTNLKSTYHRCVLRPYLFKRIKAQTISLLKEEMDTIKRIIAELEG